MGNGILKERSESDRVQQRYQRMNECVYEAKIRLSKRTRKIEKTTDQRVCGCGSYRFSGT